MKNNKNREWRNSIAIQWIFIEWKLAAGDSYSSFCSYSFSATCAVVFLRMKAILFKFTAAVPKYCCFYKNRSEKIELNIFRWKGAYLGFLRFFFFIRITCIRNIHCFGFMQWKNGFNVFEKEFFCLQRNFSAILYALLATGIRCLFIYSDFCLSRFMNLKNWEQNWNVFREFSAFRLKLEMQWISFTLYAVHYWQ